MSTKKRMTIFILAVAVLTLLIGASKIVKAESHELPRSDQIRRSVPNTDTIKKVTIDLENNDK